MIISILVAFVWIAIIAFLGWIGQRSDRRKADGLMIASVFAFVLLVLCTTSCSARPEQRVRPANWMLDYGTSSNDVLVFRKPDSVRYITFTSDSTCFIITTAKQ
jgi:hypothetical protein